MDRKTGKIRLASSKDVRYLRLSEFVDKANLKSVLINLPMTYPFDGIKRKDHTVIVSDWASPVQSIYPRKLEKEYGEYLADPPHDWAKQDKREYPRKIREYLEMRLSMYYELLEEDWNLYFVVFSETDWLLHTFPQILEKEELRAANKVFRLIGKFIETAKSEADVLFVVSDHGFEMKHKVFYINEALAENGYIEYSRTKAKFVNLIKKTLPKKVLDLAITKTDASASSVSYLSKKADAFTIEPAAWGIYLADRSKAGEVSDALRSYDEILDVVKFSAIHKGPHLDNMPDLLVIPEKGVGLSHEFGRGVIEEVHHGDHDVLGVFSAYGDSIREDIVFKKRPRVYDIVPTVLHVFGLPIPGDTDGRVLMEIFEEGSEPYKRKPRYSEHLSIESKIKTTIKKLKTKIPEGFDGGR